MGFPANQINSHLGQLAKYGYLEVEHRDFYRWCVITQKGLNHIAQFREGKRETEQDARKYIVKRRHQMLTDHTKARKF